MQIQPRDFVARRQHSTQLQLCVPQVAMARHQWSHAEAFAGRAHDHLLQAGVEDSYAAALTSAVQARAAVHRGDVPAARRELMNALRLRPLMTYAHPHRAVRLRIALIRVDLALSDMAGARTIMREIDEILRRRPDLGTLVGEAQELRIRLAAAPHPKRVTLLCDRVFTGHVWITIWAQSLSGIFS